ncbi:SoxR reducing system RseC family protein [Candidatus Margulisiibacteriota bacterium]
MREKGKVVKVLDGDKVEIEMKSTAGCSKCGLCKIGLNNKVYLTVGSNEPVSVGDNVEIEIPEKQVIFITFLIFILPLILFFLGYLIYNYVLAIVLPVIYFFWLWFYDGDARRKGKYLPYVVKKV